MSIDKADFSTTPLAVGMVTGVRTWKVDSLQRLVGVTYRQVWRPGENAAECRRMKAITCKEAGCPGQRQRPRPELEPYYVSAFAPRCEHREPRPCTGIDPECGCGFWAYHDGAPDFGDAENVVGIIQGWGVTTIGERGFRCATASIVALAFPKSSCGCDHGLRFAQDKRTARAKRRSS